MKHAYVLISEESGRVVTVLQSLREVRAFKYDAPLWVYAISPTTQLSATHFLGCRDLTDLIRSLGGSFIGYADLL